MDEARKPAPPRRLPGLRDIGRKTTARTDEPARPHRPSCLPLCPVPRSTSRTTSRDAKQHPQVGANRSVGSWGASLGMDSAWAYVRDDGSGIGSLDDNDEDVHRSARGHSGWLTGVLQLLSIRADPLRARHGRAGRRGRCGTGQQLRQWHGVHDVFCDGRRWALWLGWSGLRAAVHDRCRLRSAGQRRELLRGVRRPGPDGRRAHVRLHAFPVMPCRSTGGRFHGG
jgi:hypothetical protein